MADRVFELFDEYAAAHARGERPSAQEYLERAGDEADRLARLLDRFLAAVPVAEPDADAVALLDAWLEGESPLLELRTRRGLRRDDVVRSLMKWLAIHPAKREKVRRYYHDLETGLLDRKRVDPRVWEALAATLQTSVKELLLWPRPAPAAPAAAAYFRREDAAVAGAKPEPTAPPQRDLDEVDRLFGGAE